jgi:hypothetical protein
MLKILMFASRSIANIHSKFCQRPQMFLGRYLHYNIGAMLSVLDVVLCGAFWRAYFMIFTVVPGERWIPVSTSGPRLGLDFF